MTLELLRAPLGSELYRECLHLREAVLRAPLGLTIGEHDLSLDKQSSHFCARENGAVVACVSLKPLAPYHGKIRQMAVTPDRHGRAIGRRLLHFTEEAARAEGFTTLELNARRTAEGFYLRLGYHAEGEEFPEQGIPHIKMRKALG